MHLVNPKQFDEWVKNMPPELVEYVAALKYENEKLSEEIQGAKQALQNVKIYLGPEKWKSLFGDA